ncbi:hypothetical protein QQF64_005985 [Cirrhinus molitorella]|uniref:ribonuclease H n=1 Tax=Cirrhinus molitorella TaxID=172907 RepID=A0ABR3MG02_9TELE
MREINRVIPLVREHMAKAQQAQQRHYNRAAQPREFHLGDRVMVLVPNVACKFLATWQGPYTVLEKIGPVTYRLQQPGKRRAEQLYHINLLKKWVGTRDQLAALATSEPVVVDVNPHLSAAQKTELRHLVCQFSDVFSSVPGQTTILQHDIWTAPGVIVRQRVIKAIEDEVQEIMKLGVIEPSRSPWSSPIIMVLKLDGTLHFCNDFRWLNEVSDFDGYPMPRVDELLDRLGRARYITTLDLTKGYWQVPLTEVAKPKTAFSTPSGNWLPHQAYAAAYIDDVIIHSEAWEYHLDHLRRVLSELRRAGLTTSPHKCHLAFSEAKYLGFQVGQGLIRLQVKKVEAILTAPTPQTKTQVRAFLGLAGYYRCFIPNFSSLDSPLTDLTRKGQPEKTGLSQIQEGEEYPILYISRKLSPAERNYTAVAKEALVVKWAVLELRNYLLGRKFTLQRDLNHQRQALIPHLSRRGTNVNRAFSLEILTMSAFRALDH